MIKIFLIVIIYGIIGAFIAGFINNNDDDWIIYYIIFWPILCLDLILHKFYFLGKKTKEYLNNRSFQKLKDKERERYF